MPWDEVSEGEDVVLRLFHSSTLSICTRYLLKGGGRRKSEEGEEGGGERREEGEEGGGRGGRREREEEGGRRKKRRERRGNKTISFSLSDPSARMHTHTHLDTGEQLMGEVRNELILQ